MEREGCAEESSYIWQYQYFKPICCSQPEATGNKIIRQNVRGALYALLFGTLQAEQGTGREAVEQRGVALGNWEHVWLYKCVCVCVCKSTKSASTARAGYVALSLALSLCIPLSLSLSIYYISLSLSLPPSLSFIPPSIFYSFSLSVIIVDGFLKQPQSSHNPHPLSNPLWPRPPRLHCLPRLHVYSSMQFFPQFVHFAC